MASSSSSNQPLVAGGVYDGKRYGLKDVPPVSFSTRAPPNVDKDTIIIAAASPDVNTGSDRQDGWFLSDFYAFNYLLKGLGSSQTWLTAANPRTMLDRYGEYLHGNEFQGRKVVLSKNLLDNNQLTPMTVVRPRQMVDRFVDEVRAASRVAAEENRPLLLMLFCHGISEYKFLLNSNRMSEGLSLNRVKEAIATRCRVTLLSTACHSGGWVAKDINMGHDPLNASMLAAADQHNLSNAWQTSHSLRSRACGSIFASSVINSLSSPQSHLLANPGVGGAQAGSSTDNEVSLQPDEPTDEQVMTYNAFCTSIVEGCRDNVHSVWDKQNFTFSAQDDQWDWSWTKRTGVPLAYFEARWNMLATVPYAGDPALRTLLDPHPSNANFTFTADYQGPTGGVSVPETADLSVAGLSLTEEITDAMTVMRIDNRVAGMAALFLETCPGDWTQGWGPGLRSVLADCSEGKRQTVHTEIDIAAFIAFRWELANFADFLVHTFRLEKPNNEVCIMWQRDVWYDKASENISNYSQRKNRVWNLFVKKGFEPKPCELQGPPFTRFSQYMTAAVVLAQRSPADTDKLVEELVDFTQRLKDFTYDVAINNEKVRTRGRNWIKSVGRRVRRSLSPQKSSNR